MSNIIEVFISYSKQDEELRDGLLAHLRPLEREGIITWHDRQILPGTEWNEEIKARLNAADIILLLISADFLATDYCTQVEIPEALRRHEAGEATVIPIILRSCGWKYTSLAKIQAYPEKAEPIKSWKDIDEAYASVVDGVYLAARNIKERRSQQQAERLKQQELERQQQIRSKQEVDRKRQQDHPQQPSPKASGVDYAHLETLLKAGKWKEADQETAKQMCQIMGRQSKGWLQIEDIEQFPCADLRTIDQLWVKHSNGKFGFSVQKKIWDECGSPTKYNKHWEKFGEAVGWHSKGLEASVISYDEITFDISASQGHLPCLLGVGFEGWCGGCCEECLGLESFSSRMRRCANCGI